MDLRTLVLAMLAFCATFACGWWFGVGSKTFGVFSSAPKPAPVAGAAQQPAQQQQQQSTTPRVLVVVPNLPRTAAGPAQSVVSHAAAARPSKRFRLKRR